MSKQPSRTLAEECEALHDAWLAFVWSLMEALRIGWVLDTIVRVLQSNRLQRWRH